MSFTKTDFSNDDIVARAIELAKADDGCVVWQRYVEKARRQLEAEAHANRMAKAVLSVSVATELLKADADHFDKLQKRASRCV
jgi:hypothetical protein